MHLAPPPQLTPNLYIFNFHKNLRRGWSLNFLGPKRSFTENKSLILSGFSLLTTAEGGPILLVKAQRKVKVAFTYLGAYGRPDRNYTLGQPMLPNRRFLPLTFD
jgi:hypothetical protein